MKKVLVLGYGNMGRAIVEGWSAVKELERVVVDPSEQGRQRAESIGAQAFADIDAVIAADLSGFDLVLVAVKPQVVSTVLAQCCGLVAEAGVVLSIAAGIDLASLRSGLPQAGGIARCMPNMPASVGAGVMACVAEAACTPAQQAFISALLGCNGQVLWLSEESQIDIVTAVSGSGPAYFYLMTEYLAAAAVAKGLPAELAEPLAAATFTGSAQLLQAGNDSPARLREQVTSPAGTTAAGLAQLMRQPDGLEALMQDVVSAAHTRALALSRNQIGK